MQCNVLRVVDAYDDVLYAVVTDDDQCTVFSAGAWRSREDTWRDTLIDFNLKGDNGESREWTNVFLKEDKEVSLIAVDIPCTDVVSVIRMSTLID